MNNKIGNLLNYLSTKIPELNMTKALKLLYLIDETAYMRSGVSVTWMEYKVWKIGPVAEELYNELRNDQSLYQNGEPINLEDFIETKRINRGDEVKIYIYPKGDYRLDEFSDFEKELIDNIIDRFGSYTSKELINLLHENHTLWHSKVKDNNLKINFQVYGKSNHTIDFVELIKDDPIMQMAAQSAYESMEFHEKMQSL